MPICNKVAVSIMLMKLSGFKYAFLSQYFSETLVLTGVLRAWERRLQWFPYS